METAAELTILGTYRETLPCAITACEGRDVRLRLGRRVPPGSAVRIALPDTLLLGEVVACAGSRGAFDVTLEVEQVLRHTAALAAMARRFLDDA
ncbi:MAG: hypothetical protein IPM24_27940 [Bryobacterales bacterium]|jgi:hypothetical protein|nr:hypothetical protein [Bryobacterales bacterium]